MHPGTVEVPDGEVPYFALNPHDDDLDDVQAVTLDQIIASSAPVITTCDVAFYGGFMKAYEEEGLIDAGLDRVSGRLECFLGATTLTQAGILALRENFDLMLEPSYIWPDSREWFVGSAPELAFTVVGCQQELAQHLLEAWPGLPALARSSHVETTRQYMVNEASAYSLAAPTFREVKNCGRLRAHAATR